MPNRRRSPAGRLPTWRGWPLLAWLLLLLSLLSLPTPVLATPPAGFPTISRREPASDARNVLPDALIRISVLESATGSRVDTNTLRLSLGGRDVTRDLRRFPTDTGWLFTYQPGLLSPNSNYFVSFIYGDNRVPARFQTNQWSFSTANLTIIPANRQVSPTNGALRGFRLRSVQVDTGARFPDSSQAADLLLSLDPSPTPANVGYATLPVLNLARPGEPTTLGEFDTTTGRSDLFWNEQALDTNGAPFAVEIRGFIELPSGLNRFGFIADDGYRLALLGNDFVPGELLLDTPLGGEDGERQFDCFVQIPGLYPFRLTYWDVGGPSFLEFFSVNPATGLRTLVNDPAIPGAIKTYLAPPAKIPPALVTQPTGSTNEVGRNVTLRVIVEPELPTVYEWRRGGLPLGANAHFAGATNATLTIRNIQFVDAGEYSVMVRNAHGVITSRVAQVSVIPRARQDCEDFTNARIPSDLVSWWTGESLPAFGFDSVTEQLARPVGSVTNVAGRVGQAFRFSRTGGLVVSDPNPYNFPTDASFTIGAWVRPASASVSGTIMARRSTNVLDGTALRDFGLFQNTSTFDFRVSRGNPITGTNRIIADNWYFVAATYSNSVATLYVNGVRDGASVSNAPVVPSNGRLALGQDGEDPNELRRFGGLIDEAFFFRRALTSNEIRFLYDRVRTNASVTPLLCRPPNNLPTITLLSPASGTRAVGPATFVIETSVADADGANTIAKVEFFDGDRLIGTDVTAPYRWVWTDVAPGDHRISAVVTDLRGGATRSQNVDVRVTVPPGLTIPDASVVEGQAGTTVLPFTLQLSSLSEFPVEVDLVTRDGTAKSALDDYLYFEETVVMPPGQLKVTVPVTVKGDVRPEYDESFFLDIVRVRGAVTDPQRRSGTGTILTDDRPNSRPDVQVFTPLFGAVYTFPGDVPVTMEVTDPDQDPIRVELVGDGRKLIELTAPPWEYRWTNLGLGTHRLDIRAWDNYGATNTRPPISFEVVELPRLRVEDASETEGNANTNRLSFLLRLDKPAVVPVTARVATRSGTALAGVDFQTVETDIAIAPLLSSVRVEVPIVGDRLPEANEVLYLDVTNVVGATLVRSNAVGTIRDDEPVNVAPRVQLLSPADGTRVMQGLPVTLRADASDADGSIVRIDFQANALPIGSAVAAPYEVVWTPATPGLFPISATAIDNQGGATETTNRVVVEVLPRPTLTIAAARVDEGQAGSTPVILRARLNHPSLEPVSFRLATRDGTALAGSDYVAFATNVTLAPNVQEQEFRVDILGDRDVERDEVFLVDITNPAGVFLGQAFTEVAIANDDLPNLPPSVLVLSPTNGFRAVAPASIEVLVEAADPEGGPILVEILQDGTRVAQLGGPSPYRVRWSVPDAGTYVLTVRVSDDQGLASVSPPVAVTLLAPPTLSASDAFVVEGHAEARAAVFRTRLSASPLAPVRVAYATGDVTAKANVDYLPVAGTLEFLPGGPLEREIAVTVLGDRAFEGNETFQFVFSGASGLALERPFATGTIIDDDVVNRPPSVVLTSPPDGTRMAAPGRVDLAATATDPDGPVQRVEFYAGTTLLGTDAEFPYAFAWNDIPGGTYELSARAYDAEGAFGVSAPVRLEVTSLPTLSVADASAPEGTTSKGRLAFVFVLSRPSSDPVSVTYATLPFDPPGAELGIDFQPDTQTVVFKPGEVEKLIEITLFADFEVEPDERFRLMLSDPLNVALARTVAIGTLLNDDLPNQPPQVNLAAPSDGLRIMEGRPIALRAEGTDADGTVNQVDFLGNGALVARVAPGPFEYVWTTAAPGTHRLVAVAYDDRGATGASTNRVTVEVLARPILSLVTTSIPEGQAATQAVGLRVRLSQPSLDVATVHYATRDDSARAGADYRAASGLLTFAPGDTEEEIRLELLGDRVFEPDEGFFLEFTQPDGLALPQPLVSVTLVNDDQPNLPPVVTLASPTNGFRSPVPASLELVAQASDPDGTIQRVEFLRNGTKIGEAPGAGPHRLEWNETTPGIYSLVARAIDDLGATTDSLPISVILATDPILTVSDVSVVEGDTGTRTHQFTLRLSAPPLVPVSIGFFTLDGTATARLDYQPTDGDLVFAPGEIERKIEVVVLGDRLVESSETVVLMLAEPMGVVLRQESATLTILDDDVENRPPIVTLLSPPDLTRLPAPARVELTASAADPEGALARVEFFQGVQRLAEVFAQPFSFVWEDIPAGTYVLTAVAFDAEGARTVSAPVRLEVFDLPEISISDTSVAEGNVGQSVLEFTVRLSRPSTERVTCQYATHPDTAEAGSDYLPESGTVTFEAGSTEARIVIRLVPDLRVEPDEALLLKLTDPRNAVLGRASAKGTLVNDDRLNLPPMVTLLAPTNGLRAVAPAAFPLIADASDPDGTLVRVEFYRNDVKIGETNGPSPLRFPWIEPVPGVVAFTARAVDDLGAATTSPTATVTVVPLPVLSVGNEFAVEGDTGSQTVVFRFRLSSPPIAEASIAYALAGDGATAGADFQPAQAAVAFAPGETEKLVLVSVFGDRLVEPDETVRLVLSDPVGLRLESPEARLTILDDDLENRPPTVTLIGPADGSRFVSPARLELVATALDPEERLDRVEFFAGTNRVGTASRPPYTFVWNDVPAGTYLLAARAFDADGASTLSGTVRVDVTGRPALVIEDAAAFEGTSTNGLLTFVARLSGPSTDPISVGFAVVQGTARVNTDFLRPPPGTLSYLPGETEKRVTVVLLADPEQEPDETLGLELSNEVNVILARRVIPGTILNDDQLNLPPRVAITAPAGGFRATVPSGLELTVEASDPDGSIARVEFLANETVLGQVPGPGPYRLRWNESVAGTYQVVARAIDDRGAATLSAPVTITLVEPPTLSLEDEFVIEGTGGTVSAVVMIRLSAPALDPVTVRFATRAGTASADADFRPHNGTLSLAPGETTQGIAIGIVGDRAPEDTESFQVELFEPTGAVLGPVTRATVTILDDDKDNQPPTVALLAPLDGTRLAAPARVVLSATASDPEGGLDRVEFFAGTNRLGQAVASPYSMVWSNVPAGIYLLTAQAHDADGAVTRSSAIRIEVFGIPELAIADASASEGTSADGTLTFVARLSAPSPDTASFTYATVPDTARPQVDYRPIVATVTFARGEIEKRLDISLVADANPEPDETLRIELRNPANLTFARTSATGTILDDDLANSPPVVAWIAPTNGTRVMQGSPLTLVASASDPDGTVANVDFAVDGLLLARRQSPPYQVVWTSAAPGVRLLSVQAVDDRGATATNARPVAVEVVARPALAVESARVREGNPGTNVVVLVATLSHPGLEPVSFRYVTRDLSALAGSDYVAATGEVAFAPGETERKITLRIRGDRDVEPDESFRLDLSSPVGLVLPFAAPTVVIANDDQPNQAPLVALVAPTNGFRATIPARFDLVATASDPDGEVARVEFFRNGVKVAETNGTAPFRVPWTEFTPGTYVYTARAADDRGLAAESAPVTASILIPPTFSVADEVVVEGDLGTRFLTFRARLSSSPLLPVSVDYATADDTARVGADYLAAQGTVTFLPGETEKSIAVAILADDAFEPIESFRLLFSRPSQAYLDRTLAVATILDDDVENRPPSVQLVAPADGTRLPEPARLELTAAASDPEGAVARVEFFQGTNRLALLAAPPWSLVWSNVPSGTFQLSARAFDAEGLGATSAPVRVEVYALPVLTVDDAAEVEGTATNRFLAFTARLSKPAPGPVSVAYATLPESARASVDYVPAAGTLQFAAGETEKTVQVTLLADADLEPNETLRLVLSNPRDLALARTGAVGTILNDDSGDLAPVVHLVQPVPFTRITLGTSINLRAEASDSDGSIVRVEFLANDQPLAVDATPPYATTWNLPPPGFHRLAARAVDSSGLVSTSSVVRLEVSPFSPTVAIIGDPSEPEVQRQQDYLFAADRAASVLRPNEVDAQSLAFAQLVLWTQAGRTSVSTNEVRLLARLRDQAVPLYFIGERLASAGAGLPAAERALWHSLLHLETRPDLPAGGASLSLDPATVDYLGTIASALDYVPSGSGYESAVAIEGGVALGRHGQREALVVWPAASPLEPAGGHRAVTQNLYLATPGTASASAVRALLFQSALCYLLRCDRCAPFNLVLEEQIRAVSSPVREIVEVPVTLRQRSECVSTGVRLEATLPPQIEFVDGRAPIGQGFEHAGQLVFVIGQFDAAERLEVVLRLRPKAIGRYEFQLRARANESLGDSFDSQMTILLDATAATARPALAIGWSQPDGASLVVSWPASAEGWTLESAAAPLPSAAWVAVATPAVVRGDRREVTLPRPARPAFYRLRK